LRAASMNICCSSEGSNENMKIPLSVIPSRVDGEESGWGDHSPAQIPRAMRRSE
jgi:hypothetical protein